MIKFIANVSTQYVNEMKLYIQISINYYNN